ncbi:sigma-70 family RNA polymerase sigma factor [Parvularcula flava]|uniref:RNA polymerase sigma factor n=1 Tax=Aquisalinus luteolus TaxID=1566827 RepID=A0A8J3A3C6_9PROT|nr:sigma-70 family RNA polymerase sigma factor [Aquisalinus luteolus]NHK27979.1 sigma-70 family RNA polymerase sigma factor [Aquisalinus luteolus]GGH97106.1 RNA polymerase sigma factor [Aquisalinus luteolus]
MTTITSAELQEVLPALNRFALKLTRNADRADDLVQDCVERALNKAHLFDGQNLRSWMFTICRRVFLNQIRKEKSRGTQVDIENTPESKFSAKALQEDKMHFQDVVENFSKLPLNDKVILSLVVIEGLKYDEAAAVLEIPVGTVRSRLSRARAKLVELMEDEGVEEGTSLAAVV